MLEVGQIPDKDQTDSKCFAHMGEDRKQKNLRNEQEPVTSGQFTSSSSASLFRWRRLMEQGALESLGAEEMVVPASEGKQFAWSRPTSGDLDVAEVTFGLIGAGP